MKKHDVQAITTLYAPIAKQYPNAFVLIAVRKWRQDAIICKRAVPVKDLGYYLSGFEPARYCDYYITQNAFKGGFGKDGVAHWRRQENLLSLCNIVIDVDYHGAEARDLTYREKRMRLKDFEEQARHWFSMKYKLEFSSFFTGRGLQFWFSFKPIAPACRWMVDRLTDEILLVFESMLENDKYGEYIGMNVDEAASRRLSGVFRLPRTRNTKANVIGKIFHVSNQEGKDIHELLECFGIDIPPLQAKKKPKAVIPEKKIEEEGRPHKKRGTRLPRHIPFLMAHKDFLKFYAKKVHEGKRNICAFAYYNTVFHLTPSRRKARSATLKLNNSFPEPLPLREIETLIFKLENGEGYRYQHKNFWATINATALDVQTWKAQYKQPYLLRLEAMRASSRLQKEKRKAEREARVLRLFLKGYKQKEIGKKLHIQAATIQKVRREGGERLEKQIRQARIRRTQRQARRHSKIKVFHFSKPFLADYAPATAIYITRVIDSEGKEKAVKVKKKSDVNLKTS